MYKSLSHFIVLKTPLVRKPQILFLWPKGGHMNRIPLYQRIEENHTKITNNNNNYNDDKIHLIILSSIYRTKFSEAE